MDTKTVNSILRNVEVSKDENFIPLDVSFEIFSNMIFECATNENEDISLWGVLNQTRFNELIQNTCTALEQFIQDIPINCTDVTSRNDLIKSVIESLDITDTIFNEYENLDTSKM